MFTTTALAFIISFAAAATPTCTTTIFPTGIACCPPIAGITVTTFIDCNDCVLEIAPTPSCKAICKTPAFTALSSTTTLTACGASVTPSFETRSVTTCTSTTTKSANPCGDCGVIYSTTKTASVDCAGCGALATVTATADKEFGACVCPKPDVTTKKVCATSGMSA